MCCCFYCFYIITTQVKHLCSSRCSTSGLKPRPNGRNMSTQHIATLLGATCSQHVACVWPRVAICWVLANNTIATCQRNISQHGGQTHQHVAPNNVAICCVGMLRPLSRGLSPDVQCDLSRTSIAIFWKTA